MNQMQSDVRAFHLKAGHPAPDEPVLELTPEVVASLKARVKWLHEEARELKAALKADDLIGVIDALTDSAYFAVGGFVVVGLDMDPFWNNVQNANMAKFGADGETLYWPDGKVRKPEGWVPPEAEHAVTLQDIRSA